MTDFLAPLSAKIFGALSLALLIVIGVLWWQNGGLRTDLRQSKAETAQVRSDYALFAANVTAKSNAILAKAEENARRVETAQAQIQQETDHEIRTRIASAVAAARLRTNPASSANPGGGAGQGASAPDTPGDPAGDGQTALVRASDLTACAEAYVKATGWQAWWQSVSAIERQGEVR
jgi:hypothetical protein